MGVYDMGGWVRGVGGGAGNFRKISENFRENSRKFPGKMCGDPKTGNQYFGMRK